MHVDQGILHRRNTPQGNFIILPTEAATLLTETGLDEESHPHTPLSARPV